MNNVQIFKYNENPITFQMGEQKMVNATQMAKQFNKRTNDWLATKHAKELIASLSAKTGIPATGLVLVNQGGNNQGTWMHEDLALIFAQWLSPGLYIWCNDRIKELFQFGITATDEMLSRASDNPEYVMDMMEQVKESRQRALELEQHNKELQAQIEENAPKVNFFDNVTNLETAYNKRKTLLISKLARNFKMSAPALNKFLIRKGVIMRVDGGYGLTPKYAEENIAWQNVKEKPEYNSEGELVYAGRVYLEYYPKGVELIKDLLIADGKIKAETKS